MITPKQREQRRNFLGASDAAAVVGCDPWRNAADVYYSKISDLPDEPNDAMEVGNRMESLLLDLAEERLGPLVRNVSLYAKDQPLGANLDALSSGSYVVEAKYVGPKGADEWQESPPDHVQLQVQHQLFVSRLNRAHVVAAIVRPFVGLRFEFFVVERDDDLIDSLVTAELAFWKKHVLPKVPPENIAPSLEILKRIRRQPATIDLTDCRAEDLVATWEMSKQGAKDAAEQAEDDYAAVLALLGDSEAGELADGRILQYCEENAGLRITDLKAAQKSNPELFAPTTRRVLRIKKGNQK